MKIENRTINERNTVVDLIIDGEPVKQSTNIYDNYDFWEKLNENSERALNRLKEINGEKRFNFSLDMRTPEQKRQDFLNHLRKHYQNVDAEKIINLVDEKRKEVKLTGPEDGEHPNPNIKMEIDSDFNKMFIVSVLNEYLNDK